MSAKFLETMLVNKALLAARCYVNIEAAVCMCYYGGTAFRAASVCLI